MIAKNVLIRGAEFAAWLKGLTDTTAKVAIFKRLLRAELGNFGDTKAVGEGVHEMRIDVGAGYRVYYKRTGNAVYILLCGGGKASQAVDIKRAKDRARLL